MQILPHDSLVTTFSMFTGEDESASETDRDNNQLEAEVFEDHTLKRKRTKNFWFKDPYRASQVHNLVQQMFSEGIHSESLKFADLTHSGT